MFDVDPKDRKQRFLLSHSESDSIFEVFSEAEAIKYCNDGCDDVTGVEFFEKEFQSMKG